MTVIKLDEKLKSLVLLGKKTWTMRAGKRVYAPGPASFALVKEGVETGETIPINIDSVSHILFGEINSIHAQLEGYSNSQELKESLLDFYPQLDSISEMTTIGFTVRTTIDPYFLGGCV